MISHTYDMPGTYVVTLSDTSAICAKDPISLDVLVAQLYINILEDTIFYNVNTPIDILAETNGSDDDVSWCLEDGTNIGTGNPLEGFNPGEDTLTIIAKIVDGFGCEERDTVIVLPIDDLDDCFDEAQVTGPELGVVCADEEFELCLVFSDEDCFEENFTYLWDPKDCIISGQGTPKVVVSTSTSKTISVLLTDLNSGRDSIYNFDVEVSNPMVGIEVPELNIDVNGDPFVCLGETIELTVNPFDPNCTYTWSNGATGPTIEVSPEETLTIFVECVDEFGCTVISDQLTIPVIPPQCNESDIFIPNAFSPNGDSNNDILFVRSKFIQEMELIITNRWGEDVFVSTDQSLGWDGTYKGTALAPDAFAYCLKVMCVNGQEFIKAGNVSIIK
ncbi:MAG: T9SS type B sorting domain-containing protein [Saprospiraceae bacterium]|nr:T9SS type B sorting domain-containing protein [Saprospiraceae bacterium]